MAAPKAGDTVQVAVLSMLTLRTPPDVVGDREFYVRTGPRGARRRVQAGDLLPLGHELVELFPDYFQPAGSLPNVVVLARLSEEAQAELEADRRRRMPRLVQVVRWRCENCGAEATGEAVIAQPVYANEIAGALAEAEADPQRRREIQFYAYTQQQARLDGQAAERDLFHQLRTEHTMCPEGAELHPLEPTPEVDPDGPFEVWSGPMSLGRQR
jgi:hypothetical protein